MLGERSVARQAKERQWSLLTGYERSVLIATASKP
jgi:hypothetical protein